MWHNNWREKIWQDLDREWDLLIVGGGITGAGILREAARLGLRALLVEQKDFAYGTSSRSSKLVHGGLRYLKEGKLSLTRASVQERQKLQTAAPGLVDPLGFLFANPKGEGQRRERLLLQAGLSVYDLLALQWSHRYVSPRDLWLLAPHLNVEDLAGAFHYGDAQTDDARLVLRVLQEAVADGGTAVNYVSAVDLLREDGQVAGVQLRDEVKGRETAVRARAVINATGAWADGLRQQIGQEGRIRPLRGSHLIFPQWRFPVAQAVSFGHPRDGRPVFVFPWEGVTLVGTTDVDHDAPLSREPRITPQEVAYLMAAVNRRFPDLRLTLDDVQATFAGVRPVLDTGREDPSKESRDHVVWQEDGLLTVTGGKLTTFRLIALDALRALRARLPDLPQIDEDVPALDEVTDDLPPALPQSTRRRLIGRYGRSAHDLVAAAQPGELTPIPGTTTLWAELRWGAQAEGVVHLDDLLLRRVRLGLLLPQGGALLHAQIRAVCQPVLGWDDARWQAEWADYTARRQANYALPDPATIPDWHEPPPLPAAPHTTDNLRVALLLLALAGGAAVFYRWWRSRQRKTR